MSGKNQFLARNNLIHILSFSVEFTAVYIFGLMQQRTDRNGIDFDIALCTSKFQKNNTCANSSSRLLDIFTQKLQKMAKKLELRIFF